jgi:uncharacterized membrane protein (UPF0127 family)
MGHGMWIKPSKSIHTFFLKFAIDVVYIDAEGTVVKTCAHLRPFRISIGGPRAQSALELPSGFLELAPPAGRKAHVLGPTLAFSH